MRRVFPFVFAATVFMAVTSAHGVEASCDLGKCMRICSSEYDSGCADMCGRIISLCRQLVPKPERTPGTRPAYSPRLDAQARSYPGRVD